MCFGLVADIDSNGMNNFEAGALTLPVEDRYCIILDTGSCFDDTRGVSIAHELWHAAEKYMDIQGIFAVSR